MGSRDVSDEAVAALVSLVNLIVPANTSRGLPAAAEVGCAEYVLNHGDLSWVQDGIATLATASTDRFGRDFGSLVVTEQEELVRALQPRLARFFIRLSQEVAECYYQDPRVLHAIGLPGRPPFPEGYVVEDGDLGLLEPVVERGRIYRVMRED